jgi:hypothetical protein
MSTVDQAAASVEFGVFVPGRTFGTSVSEVFMTDDSQVQGCPAGSKTVVVSYTRRRPRRFISLVQTGKPCSPAHPSGRKIRQVRVLGRRVTVRRYCAGTQYACANGRRRDTVLNANLWLRSPSGRTRIEFTAGRLSVRQAVHALRSLRLVDLTRPVVELALFRSPDGEILCSIYDENYKLGRCAFCGSGPVNRSGRVRPDGTVELCDQATNGCIQQWDFTATLLAAGQTVRFGRFSCAVQAAAVTCTVAKGALAGTGFRIDAAGVAAISPSPSG